VIKTAGNTSAKRGIALMLIAIGLLSSMDAVAKWLLENAVHVIQILSLRSIMIVLCMLLVYGIRKRLRQLKPTRVKAQCLRGLTGFLAPFCFFLGISHMPLTAAVVVFFSSIFMTTVLSVFFLNEKVGKHRWMAVVVGYIGVYIAIRPEAGGSNLGYFLILFSSLMYTVLFISGRRMSNTESVASLVLFYNLGVGCVALLLLPWFWQSMAASDWLWLTLLSALAVAGHFCITKAFAFSEASLIAPFEYSSLVWTLAFDALIWNELPENHTWFGACIIIASGLYVLHRESQQKIRSSH